MVIIFKLFLVTFAASLTAGLVLWGVMAWVLKMPAAVPKKKPELRVYQGGEVRKRGPYSRQEEA